MKLVENVDYYLDPDGRFVLTEGFLKRRGYCCKNGCRHCPYSNPINFQLEDPLAKGETSSKGNSGGQSA